MDVTITPTAERYATIPGLPLVMPSWSDDLAAAFEAEGAAVTVGEADRVVDADRSLELWVPLIEVGGQIGIGAASAVIANALARFVGGRKVKAEVLHVRVSYPDDTEQRVVELSGSPDEIGAALRSMSD